VAAVQREDQGIYQCVASNDGDSVQAVAELRLGGKYRLKGRNSFSEGGGPYCLWGLHNVLCNENRGNLSPGTEWPWRCAIRERLHLSALVSDCLRLSS
jgi:hypothetical protein